MIPKENRVNTKSIDLIFNKGKLVFSENINLKFFIDKENISPRVSFITPKNIFKKATERNLFRRKGYFSIYKYLTQLPAGFCGAFIFTPKSKNNLIFKGLNKNKSLEKLEKDIAFILNFVLKNK